MILQEDYYPEKDLAALKRILQQCEAPGAFLEIGCWQGQSATVITDQSDRRLICVDPWDEEHDSGADRAHDSFCKNMAGRNIKIARMDWRKFLESFKEPIAFLHIDAIHTYDEVRDNILIALPLMSKGSIMCGHDYNNPHFPGLNQAVSECFPQHHVDERLWWVKF